MCTHALPHTPYVRARARAHPLHLLHVLNRAQTACTVCTVCSCLPTLARDSWALISTYVIDIKSQAHEVRHDYNHREAERRPSAGHQSG